MSEAHVCAHCGATIAGKGILYLDHVFCSDDCCDEYTLDFDEDDLDFDGAGIGGGRGDLDDDFEISPDDF